MTKHIDSDMPIITPDRDQVEAFKSTRTHSSSNLDSEIASADSKSSKNPTVQSQAPQKSSISILSTLLIYTLIGSVSFWFYQQIEQSNKQLYLAEQRIFDLEKQLSATGEEMGESASVIKVRIENLSTTSEKLWQEMDKLWASAWRKNQSQIKELQTQSKESNASTASVDKKIASILASLKDLNEKQTASEFNYDALSEKIKITEKLSSKLTELTADLQAIDSKTVSRDKQQIELASNMTELDILQKLLLERIERLEKKLVSIKQSQVITPKIINKPPTQP